MSRLPAEIDNREAEDYNKRVVACEGKMKEVVLKLTR